MSGVTTNPTIISKENKSFLEILKGIRKIIGNDNMLHVQAVATKAGEIVKEADYLIKNIGGNLYIKIPVTAEGIKAMKMLKEKGIKINNYSHTYSSAGTYGSNSRCRICCSLCKQNR